MKKYLALLVVTILMVSCSNGVAHKEPGSDGGHHHDEVKVKITSYSGKFELFAEAEPFVKGKTSGVLAHFTWLKDFKPLMKGRVTLVLESGGKVVKVTENEPARPGIYRFKVTPAAIGKGKISFITDTGDTVVADNLKVYKSEHDAVHGEEGHGADSQGISFTKERSWKIDFATVLPERGAFRKVIRTVAKIESSQEDEEIITAKGNGIVTFSASQVLEGKDLAKGEKLFSISGGGIVDNNMAVRFGKARNNYNRARADYMRAKDLYKDRIVSKKEFLKIKNSFENAEVAFNNLNKNLMENGQVVKAPFKGFVKNIYVQNGQFVRSGEPVLKVSKNSRLLLRGDVRPQFAEDLSRIVSANIRTMYDNRLYTLEELNGKVVSFGRSVNEQNYLIPVNLQIDNVKNLLPGGFVELFLKAETSADRLSIPLESVMESQGVYYVFVQIDPEMFEKREIVTGSSDGVSIEVISGLKSHERVISKGAVWVKLAQASGALDAESGHAH